MSTWTAPHRKVVTTCAIPKCNHYQTFLSPSLSIIPLPFPYPSSFSSLSPSSSFSLPINHSSPLPFLSLYPSFSSLSPSSSFSLPINHPLPPYPLPPLSLFLSIIPLPFASLSLYPSFSSLSPSSSFSLPINRPSLLLFLSLLPSFLPPPPPLSLSTQSPEGVSPR